MKKTLLAALALATGAHFTAARAANAVAAHDGAAREVTQVVSATEAANAAQPIQAQRAQKLSVDWDFASGHDALGAPLLRS